MPRLLVALAMSASLFAETALLDGRKVHYSSHGDAKEALVLIHGWTCDETAWSANVPELSKHYRVLTLDLPGHGQSDPAPAYSMESFADAASAVMTAAKVERATVAGHSMGGAVILAFARRHPRQTVALVGVDAAFLDTAAAEQSSRNDYASQFEGPGGPAAREQMIRSMFTPATTKEVQDHILKMMLAPPESVAVGAMRSMWTPAFWHDDSIDLPMIEIAAAHSSFITLQSLQRHFPKAELQRIEGTGHFLMMEKPAEFNRVLLEWLAARR